MRNAMKRLRRITLALGVLLAFAIVPATAAVSFVTINTDAADFTVVAAVTGERIHVTALDIQNIGTTNKVTVQLCDGTCGTAANIKYKFELSAASTTGMGGGWSFRACNAQPCEWILTAGSALIARVDTGATNNTNATVQYYTR